MTCVMNSDADAFSLGSIPGTKELGTFGGVLWWGVVDEHDVRGHELPDAAMNLC